MDDLDRLYRRLVHNIRANRPEYLQIPFTVRELYEQIIPYRHNRRELGIDTNDDYEVAVARLLSGERGYLQGDPAMQEQLRRELAAQTGDPGVFKDHGDATVSLTPAASDARTPAAGVGVAGMQTPVEGVPATMASAPSAAPAPASPNAPVARDAAPPVQSAPVQSAPVQSAPAQSAPAQSAPAQSAPAQSAPAQTADAQPSATSTAVASEAQVPSLLSSLSNIEMPTGCRFCGGTLPEGRDANYCPHCGENLHTKRCPACGAEMDTSWGFCVTCGRKAG
ncbi:MAG: double zinc ribbon domain-containing protein [Gemmatimonadaceae bacterium]